MTHNIAGGSWIIILLPNTAIIILFIEDSEVVVWKDFLLYNMGTDNDTTHACPDDNAESMFRLHCHGQQGLKVQVEIR